MKKKHILWVFLLTAIVATPPIYQRLSEAHRLKQIKTVKHEASQINAIPLNDFLRQLKDTSPQKILLVLYTGSTEGHLEPCGCFIGQSGGLPRRATAISSIRAQGFSPLLVDLGGILPTKELKMKESVLSTATSPNDVVAETHPVNGVHPLDQLRTQKVLESMRLLKYEALVPDKTDMNFGEDFVTDTLAHQEFPLLTANTKELEGNVEPVLMRSVGDKKVAVLGLSSLPLQDTNVLDRLLPEIQKQADFIVILSNLSPKTNRTIAENYQDISAILSHGTGETEEIGNVVLAYSGSNGETLGALLLNTDDLLGVAAQQIALTEEVEDDPQTRELLQDFYKQVADDPQLQAGGERLFSDEALEQDTLSGYVGSQACATCHRNEFDQWAHTSHATAFNTLLTVGKQFYSECVSCHVTGFRYETGYQIGNQDRESLVDVGCETCHGPGKQHITTPLTTNIRGEVKQQVCMECHTPSHSPGFEQIVEHVMPEVDHSRTEPSLKEILEQRMRGPMKPQVELFVMSFCPFGVQAEEELLPFIEKYGEAVDFNLRFIANLVEEADSDEPKFTSLHGEVEVIENLRQIAVSQLYPDQFFDFLLCRAKHLESAWTRCAEKLGLDIDKVNQEMESERTKRIFEADIQRSTALGVRASPTLVVDGKVISGGLWRGKVSGICR
ncbi:MAG: multiheme c-type cytochrome [Candidatus Poribacteria bacterium]|nr:multiheme c-type cytochrome [Candidatus Poribacteria bacterium]